MKYFYVFCKNFFILDRLDFSLDHAGNNLYGGRFWLFAYMCRNQHVGINNCVNHALFAFASLTALISAFISSRVGSGVSTQFRAKKSML